MCIIDCLSTIVFILPLYLDDTKVIILILWRRTFQLEYWRTFQLVSTGLQRKENINGPPGCIRILIMRIKKVLRRHVCREKKKRAETGSSGLARKSTSEVSCPFPSEMGYHNPIFENSVFITRSPLVYPDMVCSVSEYKILIE